MFLWGGYSFQMPQQAEHPDRPALKFPMYCPPPPDLLPPGAATAEGGALHEAAQCKPLRIKLAACGLKHAVLVVDTLDADLAINQKAGGAAATHPSSRVFGLGSNHCGQLGRYVPTYTTTLTDLQLHTVMEGDVVSVACGQRHTLVCTSSGCVYATGDNSYGQLGLTTPGVLKTSAGVNGGSAYADAFVQISGLVHIQQVYANNNASFALDSRGQVYAWGDAQYGHLGLNDTGERLHSSTLKIVRENVGSPQPVARLARHRVTVVDVAVGKAHLVCRSEEDVYTCGEGYFGKLGHGDVLPQLEPMRVVFPPRKQVEKLLGIAAGDAHTLVLKENPAIGTVVYFFGRLSNGDGQLSPLIIPMPTAAPIRAVRAGRGNQCFALDTDGALYVWGKHAYSSMSNGSNASATRGAPVVVETLLPYAITDVVVGGTFAVAIANPDTPPRKHHELDGDATAVAGNEEGVSFASWDVVVPHDVRVSRSKSEGDTEEQYEQGVKSFLAQFYGDVLGAAYAARLPVAPVLTVKAKYAFDRIGAHRLAVGQKVRLWMSNLYAIGTVIALPASVSMEKADTRVNGADIMDNCHTPLTVRDNGEEVGDHGGCRVLIEWQRDDWGDEEVTLYSDDETLAEDNGNRWQPFWFERSDTGSFVIAKSR